MPIDFLIIGAQKCGTTALHKMLAAHPQVAMARTKEVHFFDDDAAFEAGCADVQRYHAAFPPPTPGVLRGEATPIYLWWDPVPARIAAYRPDMPAIAVLGCPLRRAWSQWRMQRAMGLEARTFEDAIEAEAALCADAPQDRVRSYLARGRYGAQLERWVRLFGRERLHLVEQRTLRRDPATALAGIQAFLGLRPQSLAPVVAHVGRRLPPPPLSLQQRIIDTLAGEVEAVSLLTGWSLEHWLQPILEEELVG